MKGKRSLYNIITGMISQVLILLTAILVPRLIMVNIGSEANGLLNSVNQALVYLGLMEAGVGTVTIHALYRPVAEDDKNSICSVLAATRKYYRRTGMFYMLAVVLFAFCYPLVVDSELPNSTVVLVILFSGSAGALSYFFHGKYNLLLQAEGKQYVLSGISTVVHIVVNLVKVLLLLIGCDVVAVQVAYFIVTAGQAAYMSWYIRRKYKWLRLDVAPDEQAISQKNSVLIHQICGLIFNNTDTLLLTLSWGLKYVSVYSVFSLVFSQLGNVASILTSSIMFALGQKYQTDFRGFQKNYNYFELGSYMLTFFLSSVCAVMITPFIKLYTAGVTDVDYLNVWYPPLFIGVFLLTNLRSPAQTAITVAGQFRTTTPQAILEAGINLCVSLLLLPRFGIIGVLVGTIIALLYRTNDMIIFSAKKVHKSSLKKSYSRIVRNFVIFLVFVSLWQLLPVTCNTIMSFVLMGTVTSLTGLFVFLLFNALFEHEIAANILCIIRKMVKK